MSSHWGNIHVNPNFTMVQPSVNNTRNVHVNPKFMTNSAPLLPPSTTNAISYKPKTTNPYKLTNNQFQPNVATQHVSSWKQDKYHHKNLTWFKSSAPSQTVSIFKWPQSNAQATSLIKKPSAEKLTLASKSTKFTEKFKWTSKSSKFCQSQKLNYLLTHRQYKLPKVTKTRFKIDKRTVESRGKFLINKHSNFNSIKELFPKHNYKLKVNKFSNEKVINIGGILYRANKTKLTKTSSKRKLINKHIINVRGEKFLLGQNGKTLKRLKSSGQMTKTRIDIGGVTYLRRSSNILIRTNSHRTRNLLAMAKQRSIAILNKHKKVNIPCNVYRKLGRCLRSERGLCKYTHESKRVDLCKKFLIGTCNNRHCLLSHNVTQEKVETCQFFLNGVCSRENCPYLHVKLNKNTKICSDFLRGYCTNGKQCSLRHVNVCPTYDKIGLCKLGKKCPHPHPNGKRKKSTFRKVKKKKLKTADVAIIAEKRYYLTEKDKSKNEELICPLRDKIEELPSFIALEKDTCH